MEIIFREDVLALGERYGLGEFVRYHQGPNVAPIIRRTTGLLTHIVIVIVLFLLLYLNAPHAAQSLTHSLSHFNTSVFLYIFCCGIILILVVFMQSRKRNRIYEFTGGIIEVKKKKVIHIVQWDHMAALTYQRPANALILPSYTITMLNGKHYTLHCDTIIPSIEQAILRRELPGVLARYKAGETLSFAPISMNKEGISISTQANKKAASQSLKWSEVRQCLNEGNTLVSFAKIAENKPFQLSLYGINNACMVRELISYTTSPLVECARQQEKKSAA